MTISGKTKLIGIFGDPISHSLSPQMHNAAFKELGLDYAYLPFHVKDNQLKNAVESIRALNLRGVNVTVPHKEEVMQYLDELDEQAEHIGSVNTIVNNDGVLTGYNTDGRGYIQSLEEETGINLKDMDIMIIGAGGSARSIISALITKEPKEITIVNRTVERAEKLAEEFSKHTTKTKLKALPTSDGLFGHEIEEARLFINATTMGMLDVELPPIPLEHLQPSAIISDIVYSPMNTPMIKEAEAMGFKVHRGLGMLIYQGAIGFELWTGEKPPIDIMKKVALENIKD